MEWIISFFVTIGLMLFIGFLVWIIDCLLKDERNVVFLGIVAIIILITITTIIWHSILF